MAFVGPKTKAQRANDQEYMRRFNKYRREGKTGIDANEDAYFRKEVNTAKRRNTVKKVVGAVGEGIKKLTTTEPKNRFYRTAGENAVGEMKRKQRRETRPDPFDKDGIRTGSESNFRKESPVKGGVDFPRKSGKVFVEDNNLSSWMQGLGQTAQDRAGGRDTSPPKKKKNTTNYDTYPGRG